MARTLPICCALIISFLFPAGAMAEDSYRTPRAGEEYHTELGGRQIDVPARDRDYVRSLNLGAAFFSPGVGGEYASPFGAFYWLRNKNTIRSRGVIGIFVNEIDVAKEFGQFQLLGRWENDTVPFETKEIIDGKEIPSTAIMYGTFGAGLGVGWRLPVEPFQTDNALRLRLLYNIGYLYTHRVRETGEFVKPPPSTLVHGFRLRADYDGIRRNIMELPHQGWAMGADVQFTRRNHSRDHTFGTTPFSGDKTRDYMKFSGFFTGASGLPHLSERHRLVWILHGGYAPKMTLDRFSAFRIGGGPFPYETDDLYRFWYPGALFNQFPVTDFVIASLEYRYELLFFLYLHLRGTAAEVNRPYLTNRNSLFPDVAFIHDYNGAFSVGLTSGLPWNSQIYAEYSYDGGILRNGEAGSSFLVLWSKSF